MTMLFVKYTLSLFRRRQLPLIIGLSVCIVLLVVVKFHLHTVSVSDSRFMSLYGRGLNREKRIVGGMDDNSKRFFPDDYLLSYYDDSYDFNNTRTPCKPINKVAFLKMHKCGSSTVQNIIIRHGQRFNLTFVLPPKKNIISYPAPFHKSAIARLPIKSYDILTHHTRFSKEGILDVMSEDTVFITIIREPVAMFESIFTYFRMPYLYGIQGPNALDTFFEAPDRYIFMSHSETAYSMRNPMLFDLGMRIWDMGNREKTLQYLKYIDRTFSLVMVAEYFDESLILMKDLFCWSLDDFVYVSLNKRSTDSVKSVSVETTVRMREWNSGDVMLYEYFNHTFWEKVHAFGLDRMQEEVKLLREKRDAVYEMCIEKQADNTPRMWHPLGIKVGDFILKKGAENNHLCKRMTRPELLYTDMLRKLQYQKFKRTSLKNF